MDKILILGGTNFIGRNLIESLSQTNKFDLTLFNRGKTNPDFFSEINRINGDRNTSDIELIFEQEWDYIIDLSCYYPDSLSRIVGQINQSIKRYIFISTCSVYDTEADKSILRDETSPILDCDHSQSDDLSMNSYGNRKAECERILKHSGLKYYILRPALVYGKYDNTDRFYYWLYQIKNESDLLVSNNGKDQFSVTYVHDLVDAILKAVEKKGKSDIYNVTSCPSLSISEIIDIASQVLDKRPKLFSVNPVFLKTNNVEEWTDLPLWLNNDYFTFDNKKAIDNLKVNTTDFKVSVKETVDFYNELNWPFPAYGMTDITKEDLINKLNLKTNP